MVSERFETARNFVNKLWNAARFVLMNMEGYQPQPISIDDLPLEDRWMLSRLATVTRQVTDGIEHYRFAEAARILYDFAWDEFCSFYVEIAKPRLSDPDKRGITQSVMAHGLDTLLRLLHPMMPFVTEAIWGHLNDLARERGLPKPQAAHEFVMRAAWPESIGPVTTTNRSNASSLSFRRWVGAIRRIRASQNIPPKESVPVSIRCNDSSQALLQPMAAYFAGLAGAEIVSLGTDAAPFETGRPARVDIHRHRGPCRFGEVH